MTFITQQGRKRLNAVALRAKREKGEKEKAYVHLLKL